MPAVIAAPWLGTAIAGVAAGTGAIVGAKMQSGAIRHGADMQTAAANTAAAAQLEASQKAETFARQQAEGAYQNDERVAHANYDQWAAREKRLGSIGASLGYGTRDIPAYVGGVDPRYTDPSVTAPPPGAAPAPMPDQYGRSPGDPEYGIPRPSRLAPVPPPNTQPGPATSVGQSLLGGIARPPTMPTYSPETDPAVAELRRRQLGGTPGSVGSYLLGRTA